MRYINQDTPAWRSISPQSYDTRTPIEQSGAVGSWSPRNQRGYVPAAPRWDCELPPDARAEFFRARRPVILVPPRLERSVRPDPSLLKWVGAAALVAFILVGTIINNLNQPKPATEKQSAPIVQPTPAPAVEPAPAQPVSQPPMPPTPAVAAPRGQLVLNKRWAGHGVYAQPKPRITAAGKLAD
jgi:hypothetical protein